MTKTFTIKDGQSPTQEQLEEVRAAAKRDMLPGDVTQRLPAGITAQAAPDLIL